MLGVWARSCVEIQDVRHWISLNMNPQNCLFCRLDIISDKSHDTMISLISPLTCITIITIPLTHVQSQDPGQGTDVQCQQGFVPSNSKVKIMRIEEWHRISLIQIICSWACVTPVLTQGWHILVIISTEFHHTMSPLWLSVKDFVEIRIGRFILDFHCFNH